MEIGNWATVEVDGELIRGIVYHVRENVGGDGKVYA